MCLAQRRKALAMGNKPVLVVFALAGSRHSSGGGGVGLRNRGPEKQSFFSMQSLRFRPDFSQKRLLPLARLKGYSESTGALQ
jgi:hypothetical protein